MAIVIWIVAVAFSLVAVAGCIEMMAGMTAEVDRHDIHRGKALVVGVILLLAMLLIGGR